MKRSLKRHCIDKTRLCQLFQWGLFLFLFLPPKSSVADNFFLELKKDIIAFGKFDTLTFERKYMYTLQVDVPDLQKADAFFTPLKGQKNLFYFHAMWGGIKATHKESVAHFSKIDSLDNLISIIWHTEGFGYKTYWERALEQGKRLSSVVECLTAYDGQHYVLCHSMGNRIFEGVISDMSIKENRFQYVLLVAADLDAKALRGEMKRLFLSAKKVRVYVHEQDHLLKISTLMHVKKRLGLLSEQNFDKSNYQLIENLEFINITHSIAENYLTITNHLYFKKNAGFNRELAALISGQTSPYENLSGSGTNYFYLK